LCRGVILCRRTSRSSCGRRPFLHYANEAEALARQRLDQVLLLAGVADCVTRGIQTGRQRGI
jgi:hypothetical protein